MFRLLTALAVITFIGCGSSWQNAENIYGAKIVERYPAKVVKITDGDTVTVLDDNNNQIKTRLEAIDTPEKVQPFGTKAKDHLGDIIHERTVTIHKTGQDWFKRTLAFIEVGNRIINEQMITDGFAWHYKKINQNEHLSQMEQGARAAKRGLWTDKTAIPPWDWRKR